MRTHLRIDERNLRCIDLPGIAGAALDHMPYIHRILLENVARTAGTDSARCIAAIIETATHGAGSHEVSFLPNRVLMHDTTCGPALVDIAGLRSAVAQAGGDPARLNPVLPVDVSTDHSIGVDVFGTSGALAANIEHEMARNGERYRFMKWATQALSNFRVYPPGTGIMHTLNLERLATVVSEAVIDGEHWAIPDTLIGTDSHTPMVNGIGVLGWGVGGIEAESVMFGMPVSLRIPDVVGVRLSGRLSEGVLATDLALSITERLRRIDLANRFVEFFGPGLSALSAGDRAVVANMTPEFGANTGYFPIDTATLNYLRETGRTNGHIALVEAYAKQQRLWYEPAQEPRYREVIPCNLADVEPSVAGPRRPQDRLHAGSTGRALAKCLDASTASGAQEPIPNPPTTAGEIRNGAVAIAAITSCTNTSDPRLLIAAGLLARKARSFGLKPPAWVKTSLAPGSPASTLYLKRAGLIDDLEAIGFAIVGFGCTTCIGNSGALTPAIEVARRDHAITPVAILSGNRNFPGRVHPDIEFAFLASPPMAIAFALAGTANIDITRDVIAIANDGTKVRLHDLWPEGSDIDAAYAAAVRAGDFERAYASANASASWATMEAPSTPLYPWDPASTYIRNPPFAGPSEHARPGSYSATPLLVLGDDITTDHISPAGAISRDSETGRYLTQHGEPPLDLNVFAARRGNWEAMVRGLFTSKAVHNLLAPGLKPGTTVHAPSGDTLPLWDAALRYNDEQTPLVIVAGERYGMGSSRDWAAKGVALLGVRAVLASSFERIHRANLLGMGVLPLRLPEGVTPRCLALTSSDRIEVSAPPEILTPRGSVMVRIVRPSGDSTAIETVVAIETMQELDTLLSGGLLPRIFENAMSARSAA